ncbi:MAG: hypothetical protein IGQ45_03915 [Cyanobacterium sp. T60_A2020_053]|nr:hypothetical protein [Cyanobacterium sp. T60_A2020_053]
MSLKSSAVIVNSLLISSSIAFPALADESSAPRTLAEINAEGFTSKAEQLQFNPTVDKNFFQTENNTPTWEIVQGEENRFSPSPLQVDLTKTMIIPSAEIMPKGGVTITNGAHVFTTGAEGFGTGLQIYGGSVDVGINDKLQVGLAYTDFDDILGQRVNNQPVFLQLKGFAPNFKYQLINQPSYSLAVTGSAELLQVGGNNGLFTPDNQNRTDNILAATIQAPVTFDYTDNVKFHFVGGLAIFPDTVNNGADFYGTFFHGGAGITARFSERFGASADFSYPLIGGGNSVNNQGEVTKNPVWSAMVNYLHSPAVAFDLYVTNTLGTTPATKLLTFIPDGKQVAVGLNLRWSPDYFGKNYQASFSDRPLTPLTARDKQLLFDGFTLNTAETLRKDRFLVQGNVSENSGFQLAYGLSDDVQLELLGQSLADNDQSLGNGFKLAVATKVRFLNQSQGDPFSFSVRGTFDIWKGTVDKVTNLGNGQTMTESVTAPGSFTAQAIFNYQNSEQFAFFLSPKAGLFGDQRILGAGLGVNYQPITGLQLIGELTPMVSNDPLVWAVGARYMRPQTNWGIGVYGTNAIGSNGIGNVVTQSNDGITLGVNLLFLHGR